MCICNLLLFHLGQRVKSHVMLLSCYIIVPKYRCIISNDDTICSDRRNVTLVIVEASGELVKCSGLIIQTKLVTDAGIYV